MQLLSLLDDEELANEFQETMRIRQLYDMDAGQAYNEGKKVYRSRREFADDFCISDDKKIVFIDADAPFSSESLMYLADVVVTVAGTAGIEYAANSRVPSILAGTTIYSGFGFTIEPETEAEYFQALANIENIDPLTEMQQNTARKVFLFLWKYSDVPFSWSPDLTYKESKDPELDNYFWTSIPDLYAGDADKLLAEFWNYVGCVSDAEFSRLSQLRYPPGVQHQPGDSE